MKSLKSNRGKIFNGCCDIIFGLLIISSSFDLIIQNYSTLLVIIFRIFGIAFIIIGIISLGILNRKSIDETRRNFLTKHVKFDDEILKEDPNNVQILIKKGAFLIELEQYQDAVECFNRALEIEPDNLEATAKKRFALKQLEEVRH
jgi:tetratricopeptide (TPR) repeat protein